MIVWVEDLTFKQEFLATISSSLYAVSLSLRKLHLCFPCNYINNEFGFLLLFFLCVSHAAF